MIGQGRIKASVCRNSVLSAANFEILGSGLGLFQPSKKGAFMSDISDRVRNIVVEHLGVDADKVVDGASFIDDLGADSLDTVELVMAFEEEFGVEIPDDAAERILTVKDAISFLEENAG